MTYFFAKRKRIETFILLDIIAAVAPIGLFFGRIANFINSELYGNPSNVFWSVVFTKIDNIPRHPSQIYEALLEGMLLFIILINLSFNPKIKNGLVSILFYVGGYDNIDGGEHRIYEKQSEQLVINKIFKPKKIF